MRKISFIAVIAVLGLSACKESFKKGEKGLEYKIIGSGSGDKIKAGEFMHMEVAQIYNDGKKDSLLSDSRTNPGGSVFQEMDTTSIPPEFAKILGQLRKGDSLVIRILTDSAFQQSPTGVPAPFQKGRYLMTTVKLVDIFKTKEQTDAARKISMEKAGARMKELEAAQIIKDDKTLTEYFAKNNIKVVKAPLGTYVQVLQMGSGPIADTSNLVRVNYTGKTMAGKTFDSNTDPAFQHVAPYVVNLTSDPTLGQPVISGWYDGLKMLNKGAKAKFYIPSSLAYGAMQQGPDIAPNSILVFDIEVLDVLTKEQGRMAAQEDQKKMEEMQKKFMDSLQKANPQPAEPKK
jgi:FKBP-type peptidyl-prolyl cis-trans isomerase FkpA